MVVKYDINFSTSSFCYQLKNTHFKKVDPAVFIQITHKKVFHKNWYLELNSPVRQEHGPEEIC